MISDSAGSADSDATGEAEFPLDALGLFEEAAALESLLELPLPQPVSSASVIIETSVSVVHFFMPFPLFVIFSGTTSLTIAKMRGQNNGIAFYLLSFVVGMHTACWLCVSSSP